MAVAPRKATQLLGSKGRDGFTILEVMIALTASLLLLLSLTKAFKLIGDQITESQAEVELSSTLRDTTFRLREELRRATASMVPASNGSDDPLTTDGYLTYHEGPFTDLTT
ncbi:MAG: prepilin-type N-terminal cleavage/methylation domain-containing protein, partial [bacterium]|nr:prepilin-type N-terminal cleavage/methylation domain-containing protein [bacterium]